MNELLALMIGLGVIAILFVIPVILLVRVSGLCRGMEELQRRLIRLEGRLSEPAPRTASASAAAESVRQAEPMPAHTPVPVPVPQPLSAPQQPCAEPARSAAPAPPPAPQEQNAVERAVAQAWNWFTIGEAYRKPGESWEYAAATHWLLRTGILIVLAGVAFFDYAGVGTSLQTLGYNPIIGLGLRSMLYEFDNNVFRLDFGFNLNDDGLSFLNAMQFGLSQTF